LVFRAPAAVGLLACWERIGILNAGSQNIEMGEFPLLIVNKKFTVTYDLYNTGDG
jgi:hypothetical protein